MFEGSIIILNLNCSYCRMLILQDKEKCHFGDRFIQNLQLDMSLYSSFMKLR
jgi:hypothetical protein